MAAPQAPDANALQQGAQQAGQQAGTPAPQGNQQAQPQQGGGASPPAFILQAPPGFGTTKSKPVNPETSASEALYLKIWGLKPPKGYIDGLVKAGMNLYEIANHEMGKPAFRFTQYYRDNYAQLAAVASQAFGTR